VVEARLVEERDREAAYLEELAEGLASSGVAIRPAILQGHVADALTRYAVEHEIDVVAMTTHGRGGIQRAWLGSTTDGMVRQSRMPLLLMRPSDETREIRPTSDRAVRRLLVALDGSDAAEQSLDAALRLGITADASIVLSHVMQPPVANTLPYLPDTIQLTHEEIAAREAHVREYLDGVAGLPLLQGRDVETRILVDYEPALGILELADEASADLIVLGTHGRGGLRRMILGSVADKVIRGTHRAVLVHRGAGGRAHPLGARARAGGDTRDDEAGS
jgi:nucleotide-binding universal stress UspA family protein